MSHQRSRRVTALVLAGVLGAALVAAAALPDRHPATEAVCLQGDPQDTQRDGVLPTSLAAEVYRATRSYPGPCAVYGTPKPMGRAQIQTFAQLRGPQPVRLGFVFDADALDGLPTAMTDGTHCHDVDGNGKVDQHTECVHSHDTTLDLPREFTARVGGPFTWGLITWDPHGHAPGTIYGLPHFDFHLYMQDQAARDAIRTGPCGGEGLINCDDLATAHVPVPDRYRPADFADVGAVVSAMGNHLTDPTGPEFNGATFTHTFMYGAYAGDITFYEPMITRAWLVEVVQSGRGACRDIKPPAAWKVAGWYPTRYCVDYRANRHELSVALTDFVLRSAS
ncbi:hypothetical protein [Actinokineospora sp. NBRC 105648]|uniref:hypothetical protein n=1 Tax=Actinokineospora sp. NBRC 105648 TaxID=3032206 RepID=UPI0024A3FA8E|nr:hypothetical protein [Actinokineospora sp. NBRC 105648]GLZ38902.1 hypothetical protein Acsp05_25260 [Actinokineospora sp. NBRC 105648]